MLVYWLVGFLDRGSSIFVICSKVSILSVVMLNLVFLVRAGGPTP